MSRFKAVAATGLTGLAFVWAPCALAICPKPMPKVCSTFFESDAVFVGTVVSTQGVPDPEAPDFWGAYHFDVRVSRTFKGRIGDSVVVFTPNDSGRAVPEVGKDHVFFANEREGKLLVGGDCGPLSDPDRIGETIAAIEALRGSKQAWIEGEVRRRHPDGEPVQGVALIALSAGREYRGQSAQDGRFRIEVPPGTYGIRADDGMEQAAPYSRIDLDHVVLQLGQCAQVLFVAH